jgi:hypothetical protein
MRLAKLEIRLEIAKYRGASAEMKKVNKLINEHVNEEHMKVVKKHNEKIISELMAIELEYSNHEACKKKTNIENLGKGLILR